MLQAALCQLALDSIDRGGGGPLEMVCDGGERIAHAVEGSLQLPKVDEALEVNGAALREIVGLYSSLFSSGDRVHSPQHHHSHLVQADGDLAHGLAGFAHEQYSVNAGLPELRHGSLH